MVTGGALEEEKGCVVATRYWHLCLMVGSVRVPLFPTKKRTNHDTLSNTAVLFQMVSDIKGHEAILQNAQEANFNVVSKTLARFA